MSVITTTARTIAVERKGWSAVLDEFSARHASWLVSLDVLSPDMGAQPAFSNLPLVSAALDAETGSIVISAGRTAADHITHPIEAPSRLWVERTEAGADAALGIESAGGVETILRLKTAALPETVDGWYP